MNYTKHYFPDSLRMKVFLKRGSSLELDLATGKGMYELVKKRPLISGINRLHYNPNLWWTIFSDLFALSLILITITGAIMNKGKKGLIGRGGIELIIGITLSPIIYILHLDFEYKVNISTTEPGKKLSSKTFREEIYI